MKVLRIVFRNATMFGLCALGLYACSKASDPKAITVDTLKYPSLSNIRDNGNGAVTIFWKAANNEDDFDGYNVYGMKDDGTANGVAKLSGNAIQLLDENGDAVQAARDNLALFNYSPADGFKLEKKAEVTEDKEKSFSALPIHTVGIDGKPLLPTCKRMAAPATPDLPSECVNTTKDNFEKSVSDNGLIASNGMLFYKISGLTPGQTYCFTVLASIKAGKKVSQTSSEVGCIRPRIQMTMTLTVPSSTSANIDMDLETLATKCTVASCPAPTVGGSDGILKVSGTEHAPTATLATYKTQNANIFIEYASTPDRGAFVVGDQNGVQDLGYYKDGFNDATLTLPVPALTIGTTDVNNGNAPVVNRSGYAVAGQSVLLFEKHLYAIAAAKPDEDTKPTSFRYYLVWIDKDAKGGASISMDWRIATQNDQRD